MTTPTKYGRFSVENAPQRWIARFDEITAHGWRPGREIGQSKMCANKLPERHPLKALLQHLSELATALDELRAANVAKLTDEQRACYSSMVKEIEVDWTYGHIVAFLTRFVSTEMTVSSGLRGAVNRVDTLQTGPFWIDNPILANSSLDPTQKGEIAMTLLVNHHVVPALRAIDQCAQVEKERSPTTFPLTKKRCSSLLSDLPASALPPQRCHQCKWRAATCLARCSRQSFDSDCGSNKRGASDGPERVGVS